MRHATKKLSATLGTAVTAVGITACDSNRPEPFVFEKAEIQATGIPVAEGETLEAALRDRNPWSRARRLAELFANSGPEAVPEVAERLQSPMTALGAAELDLLLRYWATHEPEAAARWAAEESPKGNRFAAVLTTVEVWAEQEPRAVAAFIDREWSKDQEVYGPARVALVRGWFTRDPEGLVSHMQLLGYGLDRQRLLSPFVKLLIRRLGPAEAAKWAESLPEEDEDFKVDVYRLLASALTLLDLEAALRWCEAQCDGPYDKDLRTTIATRWLRRDGAAAFTWLSEAPPSPERSRGLRFGYLDWAKEDRDAALAFMRESLAGEPRDWHPEIYAIYARVLALHSPAEAIEWADRVDDEEQREAVLVQIARHWRTLDEDAAEVWLLQSPLSEEAREQVRAPLPNQQPPG